MTAFDKLKALAENALPQTVEEFTDEIRAQIIDFANAQENTTVDVIEIVSDLYLQVMAQTLEKALKPTDPAGVIRAIDAATADVQDFIAFAKSNATELSRNSQGN